MAKPQDMSHLPEKARAFHRANLQSGVVKAKANEDGGGTYTLADGTKFTLTKEECQALAIPVWDSE